MPPAARDGWIFGRRVDPLVFFGPFLFAALGVLATGGWASLLLASPLVVLARNLVDECHVVCTFYVAVQREQTGLVSRLFLYSAPAVVLLGMGAIAHVLSPAALLYFMAYWSIWHNYRQQHGWIMLSRAAAAEPPATRLMDVLMMINIIQYPVIFWHSAGANFARSWLNTGDLPLSAGAGLTLTSLVVHWAFNGVYVGYVWAMARRQGAVNRAKLVILLSTWLVYYGGLVLANSIYFWTFVAAMTHGIPYLVVVYRSSVIEMRRRKVTPRGWLARIIFLNALVFPLLVGGLATFWWDGPKVRAWLPALNAIPYVFWFPTMLHYYLDTVVWRRRRRPPSTALAPEPGAPAFDAAA